MNSNLKQIAGFAILAAVGGAQAACSSSSSSSCGSATLNVDLAGASSTPLTSNELAYGQTFFGLRPQHSNVARDQMGTAGRVHQFAKEEFHGDVSLALQWQQSRNASELGSWFFFNGTNSMKYGPNWTQANNSNSVDVNSLNFGVTASGTITASPRVQNLVADLQLYLGWDEFISGVWTKVGVPINYVRTDMKLVDTVTTADAVQGGTAGKFLTGDVDNSNTTTVPYSNLAKAWVGDKTAGDLPVRKYGNISGRRSETRVAGLSFELGYDFLRREEGHLGLALRTVMPTGNTPYSEYVFEPISGANNSWEIGGSVNGAYELWSGNDDDNLQFFVNGNVTTLGRRAQRRLLGLKNILSKPGSSWLMLKKFNTSNQYDGSLEHAANLTSLVIKVGSSVMADAAASLKYNYGNYGFAVGYNFWHRSKEKADARETSVFGTVKYGIKEASGTTSGSSGTTSTVMASANTVVAPKATSDITKTGITVTSSPDSQYLTDADIDVSPALHPSAQSHKVFGSLEYNWKDNEWEPYFLVGGSYEVGAKSDSIKNSAVDQWGVMAKGGIAF